MICILRYMLKAFWGDHKEDFDFVLLIVAVIVIIFGAAVIMHTFPIIETIIKYVVLAIGVILSIVWIVAILRAVISYTWLLFKEAREHCK